MIIDLESTNINRDKYDEKHYPKSKDNNLAKNS